ncbi:MAG TPA: organomercurial lyase, partial [Candidatus Limnocylindria bacterium]|nr:organomercurial lyase [Candidatus Limnocylindria bacterium]
MTMSREGGCDDCCDAERPVFLSGGDELAVRLRELAFGILLITKEPVEPATLARLAGSDEGHVAATLDGLVRAGRIDRDEQGRVLGAAGLTIGDGPHGLRIDGYPFRTWCAFDALGIPAATGIDARVETACGVCGRPIEVDLRNGQPRGQSSARLWLSVGGVDMRADFCTPTVLLCSPAHAMAWAERHGGHGRALALAEAVDLGATNWASVAATAAELRSGSTDVHQPG